MSVYVLCQRQKLLLVFRSLLLVTIEDFASDMWSVVNFVKGI